MNHPSTPPWPEGAEGEEPEISAEEAELAAELTRALELGSSGKATDPRVLPLVETAGLVQASQKFDLSPAREQALRGELSPLWKKAPVRAAAPTGRLIRVARWLPLPVAAGGALLWGIQQHSGAPLQSEAPREQAVASAPTAREVAAWDEPGVPFPAPSAALVRAQTEVLVQSHESGGARADVRQTLDRGLSDYRQLVLASLGREEGPE